MSDVKTDALVVLGGGIDDTGQLTAMSKGRVEAAADSYKKGLVPRLILSGRCGSAPPDPDRTAARVMADYAIERGVPSRDLLLEESSRETIGNAYFTRRDYLGPEGWYNITAITSAFHIPRSARVFKTVLGDQYHTSFIPAFTEAVPDGYRERWPTELEGVEKLNSGLGDVPDGDMDAVRSVLQDNPAYPASAFKYSD